MAHYENFYKELLEQCDIFQIAEALDLEMTSKGSNTYIRCPEHEKRTGRVENIPDNCIIKNNGYYCYSCQASGDVFHLIMHTCNVPCNKAMQIAAEIMGFDISEYQSNSEIIPTLPITRQEINLIGLHNRITEIDIKGIAESREMITGRNKEIQRYSDYETLVYGTETNYALMDLWKEDKEGFWFLIQNKIMEAQVNLVSILESDILFILFQNRNAYSIAKGLEDDLHKLNELARKCNCPVLTTNKKIKRISRFCVK